MYYAIRNKQTGKYISGTDFRYRPPRQIPASEYCAPRLFADCELHAEIEYRKINLARYEVVAVAITEIKK